MEVTGTDAGPGLCSLRYVPLLEGRTKPMPGFPCDAFEYEGVGPDAETAGAGPYPGCDAAAVRSGARGDSSRTHALRRARGVQQRDLPLAHRDHTLPHCPARAASLSLKVNAHRVCDWVVATNGSYPTANLYQAFCDQRLTQTQQQQESLGRCLTPPRYKLEVGVRAKEGGRTAGGVQARGSLGPWDG